MNTELQTLIKLQDVDGLLLKIQQKIDEFPEIMQQLDKQLNNSKDKVAQLKDSIDEQEKLRRSKERDIETQNEQIKKYQGQLLQVKTNKEYSALLLEIKSLKNKNSLTEDDILELLEGIERAKNALANSEKELKNAQDRIQQEKQKQETALVGMQGTLKKEQQNREQLAQTIDENMLREYTKLLKLRNGLAMASVDETGICNGCRVALTPQMFAEVKTGKYLHRCPICFRFIYWADTNHEDTEE